MKEINQNLISLINKSQFIGEEDKKIWQVVVDGLPETFVKDIFDFLNSYPDRINLLTTNLKEKMEAIKSGDASKFEDVISKDEQLLNVLQ